MLSQWHLPLISTRGSLLETTEVGRLTNDAITRRQLTVELDRHVELLNSIDTPGRSLDREVNNATFSLPEDNSPVERSRGCEDPHDGAGCRVDDQSRNDSGSCVTKVEAEKELALAGGACGGNKRPLPEGRAG